MTVRTRPPAAVAPAALLALLATFCLGAVFPTAGCGAPTNEQDDDDGSSTEEPRTDKEGVEVVDFHVEAASTSVKLGDEIVFEVRLTNTSDDKQLVGLPRLGRKSVSFRVRLGDDIATLERFYVSMDERTGRLSAVPNDAEELAPGKSVERQIRTTALRVGKTLFTPLFTRMGSGVTAAPAITIEVTPNGADKRVGIEMKTSHGDLVVGLRPDLAYATCASFASLTRQGFYDGLTFHRIVKGFMAQGGDPLGTGAGGPGYFLPLEAHRKMLHARGVLSMARTNRPDTGGSQFFLMFKDYPSLDPRPPRSPGYTAFGRVEPGAAGDKTLARLEAVGSTPGPGGGSEAPSEKVTIKSAKIVTLP